MHDVMNLAYCAGVVDSDGHIGLHRHTYRVRVVGDAKSVTYQPRLQVKQIDAGAIDVFVEEFGGHYYVDSNNKRGSARPINIWQVHSAAAGRALTALRPFLRIKWRQADIALEVCELNASTGRRRFDVPPLAEGEPMMTLADAAAAAGKSYATAYQSVRLGNIPFDRRGRRVYVPESFIPTWRERGKSPTRNPRITAQLEDLAVQMKSLNSGVRQQSNWSRAPV